MYVETKNMRRKVFKWLKLPVILTRCPAVGRRSTSSFLRRPRHNPSRKQQRQTNVSGGRVTEPLVVTNQDHGNHIPYTKQRIRKSFQFTQNGPNPDHFWVLCYEMLFTFQSTRMRREYVFTLNGLVNKMWLQVSTVNPRRAEAFLSSRGFSVPTTRRSASNSRTRALALSTAEAIGVKHNMYYQNYKLRATYRKDCNQRVTHIVNRSNWQKSI